MAENKPKSPPPPPQYLSEVPSRSYAAGGTYKHHRNIGHAKAAIIATKRYGGYGKPSVFGGGTIYKWDTSLNVWETVYEVPAGTSEAELPWVKDA